MTVGEAMTRVGRLRPDAYGEEIMTGWLSELDGKYRLSLEGKAGAAYAWPGDAETALFAPFPYDIVYELYLVCLIDWHNREIEAYQNDKAMFDAADAEFRAWWIQHYGSQAADADGTDDTDGGGGERSRRYWRCLR